MERTKVPKTVMDDRTCSLSTLRAQAGKPLRDTILDIYAHRRSANEKSTKFLRNLKCFLPVETGDGYVYDHDGQSRHSEISLRTRLHPKHYVAISYPWHPSDGESASYRYQLAGSTVSVRDNVLDRVIRFIRYKQRPRDSIPFWIDKLSIDQDNEPEREIAMQSMDEVYKKCTYAVGYLWTEIETQAQINRLWTLFSNQIVKHDPDERFPVLSDGIDAQAADDILDVLIRITDDQWWNRAWIFQEDYLAGTKMWLLIRHRRELDKSHAREKLGSLSGELVIKSDTFRKYLTLFCLALCQKVGQSSLVGMKCHEILKKASKYNVLYQYSNGGRSIPRMMTINVLKDLNSRRVSVPADILAITANVCGYDSQILVANSAASAMSLSLGILTLFISNGEIIQDDYERPRLYENVFDFLGNRIGTIGAPLPDGALTFIKHCRLPVNHLSLVGIHTTGILWKLSDTIHPDRFRPNSIPHSKNPNQRDVYRRGLGDYQRNRLLDLVRLLNGRNKQRYQRLANDLALYLERREPLSNRGDWPPRFVMDLLATCIVDAMDTGKYLQLARPAGDSPGEECDTPYRAVFIRDRHDMQRSGPGYIFTSWSPTNEAIWKSTKCKVLAKYVSLEVGTREIRGHGLVGLKSKQWTNGLCFFGGERKCPFIFPWPEALCK